MAKEAVIVKPAVVGESRMSKFGYIGGSLGMLAGFGFAYKKESGVLGWLGYGLLGSFIGGTLGSVIATAVGEKMVAVVAPVKAEEKPKTGGLPPKNTGPVKTQGGLPTDKTINADGNDSWKS